MLHPARLGKNLLMFQLTGSDNGSLLIKKYKAGTGRTLVKRTDIIHWIFLHTEKQYTANIVVAQGKISGMFVLLLKPSLFYVGARSSMRTLQGGSESCRRNKSDLKEGLHGISIPTAFLLSFFGISSSLSTLFKICI